MGPYLIIPRKYPVEEDQATLILLLGYTNQDNRGDSFCVTRRDCQADQIILASHSSPGARVQRQFLAEFLNFAILDKMLKIYSSFLSCLSVSKEQ